MDKLFIIVKTICSKCKGYGIVTHPFYYNLDTKAITSEELLLKARESGYDDIPKEKIECPYCNGYGWNKSEIGLNEFITMVLEEIERRKENG